MCAIAVRRFVFGICLGISTLVKGKGRVVGETGARSKMQRSGRAHGMVCQIVYRVCRLRATVQAGVKCFGLNLQVGQAYTSSWFAIANEIE